MKFTIVTILLLVIIAVHADNTVVISCYGCFSQKICLNAQGGGFGDGTDFISPYNTCQELFPSYPTTFQFNCDTNSFCDEGCLIIASSPGTFPEQACSQDAQGSGAVQFLNMLYAVQQQSEGATYDWCGCGLSTIVIILIVVAVIVGVAIIGGAVFWCIKKAKARKQDANYAAMRDRNIY